MLASSCYAAAGAQASRSLLRDEPWDWVRMLANWALYALLAAGIRGVTRAGWLLPAGARSGDRGASLEREEREFRRARWAVLVVTQLIAGLVAAAAVVEDDPAADVWALAVALGAFVVVPLRWFTGRLRRVRDLQSGPRA